MRAFTRIAVGFAKRCRCEEGAVAVEFAMVLPVMLLCLFAIIQFGIVMNNDVELASGVSAGAREMAISRNNSTPYTNATQVFQDATPNLGSPPALSVNINGTACNSDSSCEGLLTNAQGDPVTVSDTYPCNLLIVGINFAPGCNLSSSTTQVIQ